jgi:predicted ABC-type ATPase
MNEIVIFGGPNGAGKTTAAKILLPKFFRLYEFVNADEIARTISPQNAKLTVFKAARMMIERVRANLDAARISRSRRLARVSPKFRC